MKKKIASNMYLFPITNGVVLFSYETPVAARIGNEFFRTTTKWSQTTTKHINKWFKSFIGSGFTSVSPKERNQEFFFSLLEEEKEV